MLLIHRKSRCSGIDVGGVSLIIVLFHGIDMVGIIFDHCVDALNTNDVVVCTIWVPLGGYHKAARRSRRASCPTPRQPTHCLSFTESDRRVLEKAQSSLRRRLSGVAVVIMRTSTTSLHEMAISESKTISISNLSVSPRVDNQVD